LCPTSIPRWCPGGHVLHPFITDNTGAACRMLCSNWLADQQSCDGDGIVRPVRLMRHKSLEDDRFVVTRRASLRAVPACYCPVSSGRKKRKKRRIFCARSIRASDLCNSLTPIGDEMRCCDNHGRRFAMFGARLAPASSLAGPIRLLPRSGARR